MDICIPSLLFQEKLVKRSEMLNKSVDEMFNEYKNEPINKSVNNLYGYDCNGILVRRKFQNKKHIYGWILTEDNRIEHIMWNTLNMADEAKITHITNLQNRK